MVGISALIIFQWFHFIPRHLTSKGTLRYGIKSLPSGSVRHFDIALLWEFTNHDDFALTVRYGPFSLHDISGFCYTITNLGSPTFYPRERPEGAGYEVLGRDSVRTPSLLSSSVSTSNFASAFRFCHVWWTGQLKASVLYLCDSYTSQVGDLACFVSRGLSFNCIPSQNYAWSKLSSLTKIIKCVLFHKERARCVGVLFISTYTKWRPNVAFCTNNAYRSFSYSYSNILCFCTLWKMREGGNWATFDRLVNFH